MEDDLDILLLYGLHALPFGSSMDAVLERLGEPAERQTAEQLLEKLLRPNSPHGRERQLPHDSTEPLYWEYPQIKAQFQHIDGSHRLVSFEIGYGSQYRLFGNAFGEPYDETFLPMIRSHGLEILRADRTRKDVIYQCSHGVSFYTNIGDVMAFWWSIFDHRIGPEEIDQPAYDRLRSER